MTGCRTAVGELLPVVVNWTLRGADVRLSYWRSRRAEPEGGAGGRSRGVEPRGGAEGQSRRAEPRGGAGDPRRQFTQEQGWGTSVPS